MRALLLGTIALALGTAFLGQPAANADFTLTPKGKIVTPKNDDVQASCKLEVNKVSPENDYATTITLTANAWPATLDGYRANRYTQVDCYVYSGDLGPLVAEFHPYANSGTVLPTSKTFTIAYAQSYTLCGDAFVKLKDGDSSFTPYVCA